MCIRSFLFVLGAIGFASTTAGLLKVVACEAEEAEISKTTKNAFVDEAIDLSADKDTDTILPEPDKRKTPISAFFKLIWEYISPYKLLLLSVVCATLATAYVNLLTPGVIGELTAAIQNVVKIKELTGIIDLAVLKGPGFRLFGLFLSQGILTTLSIFLTSMLGENLAHGLRTASFKHLLTLDISYFDSYIHSDVTGILTSDIQDLKHIFKLVISQGLKNFAQLVGSTYTLFQISPLLSSALLAATPFLYLAFSIYGSHLRALSKSVKESENSMVHVSNEVVLGMRVVKSFNGEEMEGREFNAISEDVRWGGVLLGGNIGIFQGMTNLTLGMLLLSILYFGGQLVGRGHVSAGKLMTFLVTTQNSTRAMSSLGSIFGQVSKSLGSGARVAGILAEKPIIGKGLGAYTSGTSFQGLYLSYLAPSPFVDNKLVGEIAFKDVTFTYPSRPTRPILENFSLTLPKGKVIALCGESGSGKSTIASLLNRFFDPNVGSIIIDGVDLKNWDLKTWRDHVGYITQEPVIFSGTILSNILYGCPSASISQVVESCQKANCWEFIQSLPDGLDTKIGERGVELSGGERQRVAIARCFLKDPEVLVLDEATSSLDNKSEKLVTESLNSLIRGNPNKPRTTLIIAHRLSTIQNADLIVVVGKGSRGCVEMGTHDELLKLRAVYFDLWQKGKSGGAGEKATSPWW